MKTTSLFIPLLTAVFVSAHGILRTLTINGQAYTGNTPTAPTDDSSPIQLISTYFPIKGATNSALTCGPNSTAGAIVANANPGDSLTFSWKAIDLSNWIHDTGPFLLYLANCESTPFGQFDITNAKWFKIDQQGRTSPGGPWVQAGLTTGGVVTSSLPTNLAAGNYLLRSELISLQNGMVQGGAEFYVACSQIEVGGSGTGVPQSNELVSLPGAYSDDDPGILDVDVYNNKTAPYIFPGPGIAAFVTGGTSSDDNLSTSSSGSSSTTTTSTATTPGSVPSTASSIGGPSSLPDGSLSSTTPDSTSSATPPIDSSSTISASTATSASPGTCSNGSTTATSSVDDSSSTSSSGSSSTITTSITIISGSALPPAQTSNAPTSTGTSNMAVRRRLRHFSRSKRQSNAFGEGHR